MGATQSWQIGPKYRLLLNFIGTREVRSNQILHSVRQYYSTETSPSYIEIGRRLLATVVFTDIRHHTSDRQDRQTDRQTADNSCTCNNQKV